MVRREPKQQLPSSTWQSWLNSLQQLAIRSFARNFLIIIYMIKESKENCPYSEQGMLVKIVEYAS